MKFTAEITFAAHSDLDAISGPAIAQVAVEAEQGGYDAISFNEHPAPSAKWLAAGGHDAYDPFVVLTYCAAVTKTIRLIPYLFVLPYRNPFITAKSAASLDVLSGGRFVVATCIGYLRSEFAALGVPYERRFEIFDESLLCIKAVWSGEAVSHTSERILAKAQVATPLPIRRPHRPIWIGGNSRTVRERVAKHAQGWAPLIGDATMARTTRTPEISSLEQIEAVIAELHGMLRREGRSPDVEIQMGAVPELRGRDKSEYYDYVRRLEDLGVTQFVTHFQLGGTEGGRDAMNRFADVVMSRFASADVDAQ